MYKREFEVYNQEFEVYNPYFKYKKRLLLRCIHHSKSDLINNMDHMRISGTKPSSVILSQTLKFKKLKRDQSVENQNIYVALRFRIQQLIKINIKELPRVNRTYHPVFNLLVWRIWG